MTIGYESAMNVAPIGVRVWADEALVQASDCIGDFDREAVGPGRIDEPEIGVYIFPFSWGCG